MRKIHSENGSGVLRISILSALDSHWLVLLTEKYIEGPSDGHFVPAPACRADAAHSKTVKCFKTIICDKEEYRRSTCISSALKGPKTYIIRNDRPPSFFTLPLGIKKNVIQSSLKHTYYLLKYFKRVFYLCIRSCTLALKVPQFLRRDEKQDGGFVCCLLCSAL